MAKLTEEQQDFDARGYLAFTEMIGKLACRYTCQLVMVFDQEYWHGQATTDNRWGEKAPYLSLLKFHSLASA